MDGILRQAQQMQDELVAWRRQLHQNPEIGMELPETAGFVYKKLEEMGCAPRYFAGSGVTALIGGQKAGKCFLLRADMDALPLTEEADVPFKSTNGNMHACGHDFHTATLLGAARLLKAREGELWGTVKLMFQPAEETMKGAKAMLEAGILENPKVDGAAMIHVSTGHYKTPCGVFEVPGQGVQSAAADWFEIRINGKGGHGAMPEKTVDPLNVAAHIHIALQTIQSREISAAERAVVTVGMMAGGSAGNVIPDSAVLRGTIRTFDETVRRFIFERVVAIAQGVGKTFRAQVQVDIAEGCPSVICDGAVSGSVRSGLRAIFGDAVTAEELLEGKPMSASEDFAFVSQCVPSSVISLMAGSCTEGYIHPLHHPKAVFNEDVLWRGAAAYAAAAINWLTGETAGL